MKILYYHQHFSTPKGSTGNRSYMMARTLVQRGHQVVMVCGSYQGANTGLTGEFKRGQRTGIVDGIDIVEFFIPYSNKDGFLTRTIKFLMFSLRSTMFALKENYDLIFATSTPLTAAIPGIFAKILRRKKFIFEVRDLWPELPVAMGVIKNPVVIGLMKMLEFSAYKLADKHIGLSPGIVDGIARHGIDRDKIASIPNGCDFSLFQAYEKVSIAPGVKENDFVAIFSGTHGVANGLDAVLDAAREILKLQRDDIKLVLVGDGKLKPALMQRAHQQALHNVIFLDPVSKHQLAVMFSASHIGMQILANVPAFYYGTSPNKFFDYIAFGLPVLINYPGWLADLVEKYQCGIVVKPENPADFAKALIYLADHREKIILMTKNAQSLARENFDRKNLAAEFVSHLESVFRSSSD